ncbi:GNAT family N-acetyltransferase [Nostoc sp.]|uniref:GNAT family N-acetyltransferase n=1 Tax=Nostoc sp. TaxID=1180 RepID=UPI002FFCEF32
MPEEIRLYEDKDLESVSRISKEVIPKSHPFLSHEYAERDINNTIEQVKKCKKEGSIHTWVICEDNKVVGFTTIEVLSSKTLIISLYVSADYQRKGYGTKLLDKVFSGYKPAYLLVVYKENKEACKFYKNRGFRVDTSVKDRMTDDREYLEMKRN